MIQAIDLIGDSIFDNQPYVDSGDSVIEQISVISSIPVNLLAVDGDTTIHCLDVLKQQGGAKADIGAVLSVGGNDALQSAPVLSEPTNDVFEALTKLGVVADTFRRNYLLVLKKISACRSILRRLRLVARARARPVRQRSANLRS